MNKWMKIKAWIIIICGGHNTFKHMSRYEKGKDRWSSVDSKFMGIICCYTMIAVIWAMC